jgi:hypothetical protein
MSGGGGGGGTQVLRPEPWVGDIDVSYGNRDRNILGLYGQVQDFYRSRPQQTYGGPRVVQPTQFENQLFRTIAGQTPQIGHQGNYALQRARQIAGTRIGDQGGYAAALEGIPELLGGNFGIGNIGNWQGTVAQQGTGQINPFLGALAQEAQNRAFRGYDRALAASEGTGAQQISQALGGFGRAAEGALGGFDRAAARARGEYQRATQAGLGGINEALATANRDFTEQVLPSIRGAASGVGGYGGSRHGIAEGLAARGQIESLNRAIGRTGEGFGLGAAQLGENLGLGAGQVGQGLALSAGGIGEQLLGSAQERQRQAYLSGQQAAESAAGLLPQLYSPAFESAQSRALQAAGLGLQGGVAGADVGLRNKQLDIGALTNLGQLGNQRLAATGNIALGGLEATPIGSRLIQNAAGLYGLGGELQRGIQQQNLDAQRARFYEPYQNRLRHLQNYVNLMSASRPPVAGAGTPVPVGTSPIGSALGGALGGAGTGALLGSVVPGLGTGIGALGGGLLGGLAGLFS